MIVNEPQRLRYEYSRVTKILYDEYKPEATSLDDDIKIYEFLHVEEQHHLKILLQEYEYLCDGTSGEFKIEY
jgi:hypothetical protein